MDRKVTSGSPIGVFDSGLGGLTVVRELRRELPGEKIVYFGDVARLPYGIKSENQIRDFSKENTEFLLHRNVKAIVVACNSSSSAAFSFLKSHYHVPIIDVIRPAAQIASHQTSKKRIGIIATQATIASKAYEREIAKIDRTIKVFSKACPLLVPLVEEGILDGSLIEMVLMRYLSPLLKQKIDTLILGCTHYPLLRTAIRKIVGTQIKLVDSAPATVRELKRVLLERSGLRKTTRSGKLQVFVSDLPANFLSVGSNFLGEPLRDVKVVRFKAEITVNGKWTV